MDCDALKNSTFYVQLRDVSETENRHFYNRNLRERALFYLQLKYA